MLKFDFAVIGGDRRTSCMASVLAKRGYRTVCFNTVQSTNEANPLIYRAEALRETLDSAPVIIAGIPFAKNDCLYCEVEADDIPISELQRCLRKKQKIFGGVIPEAFRRTCEEREIGCYDFMTDEPITLFNAIAAAEGAILEAFLHKDTNIHMSNTLVLGYGRCAKVLADKLRGLSANVTVCSSDEKELALALALGFDTLSLSRLAYEINRFEYIFNTIPACVLTETVLKGLNGDTLIIDIASNKVGADYDTAKELGTNIFFCPGLPGKYSGQSCAERLVRYVIAKSGNN